jgi:hypothetical protein
LTVVSSDSGQIEYVCNVNPVSPINTASSSPTVTDVPVNTCQLWRVEVRIPPGHQGLTGLALVDSGVVIVPYESSSQPWLIGDDDLLTYPYDKQLGANVVIWTYNVDDTYSHGWQVRLIYTPSSAINASAEPIVVPASLDWLTGTAGGG